MPISTQCPRCAAPLDILEHLRGKKVCCPGCRHVFLFDGSLAEAEGPARNGRRETAAAEPRERSWGDAPEGRPRERSSGTVILVVLAAGLGGLLVLVGGALVIGSFVVRGPGSRYDYATATKMPAMAATIAPKQ